jgi:hypothetical protein
VVQSRPTEESLPGTVARTEESSIPAISAKFKNLKGSRTYAYEMHACEMHACETHAH